jgi:hypothetical protein
VRITFLVVLALCGGFGSAAVAGGINPVETVTGVLPTIASQTTVASDLTDQTAALTGQTSATSDATAAATGLVGTATSGGGTSSTSGSNSGAQEGSRSGRPADTRRSSKHASTRTRFDRLPRRYEILLERIESGHKVRASIARLRSLLAEATPRMRARILRLIRSEIRRLERNGLTHRERGAVRRLHRLLVKFAPQPSPPSAGPASSPATSPSATATFPPTEIDSAPADRAAGVASTEAAGRQSSSEGGRPTLRIPGVLLPAPPPPADWFQWLLIFLWALAIAAVAATLLRAAVQLAARLPRNRH